MSTETRPDLPAEAADLMAQLVMANVDNLAATTDRIIEDLTNRAEDAEATLGAIREEVRRLFKGDYMPTPSAIQRALWPTSDVVTECREAYRELSA